jgi:hypothetical protein
MSTKTLRKRIALVAVAALGAGVLSVAPANAAPILTNEFRPQAVTTQPGVCAVDTTSGAQSVVVTAGSTFNLVLTQAAGTDDYYVSVSGNATVASVAGTGIDATTLTSVTNTSAHATDNVITFRAGSAGSAAITVKENATASAIEVIGVTVVASCSNNKLSLADSFIKVGAVANASSNIDDSAYTTVSNGETTYINIRLRDAYLQSLTGAGVLLATATNGAVIAWDGAPTVQSSTAYLATRGVANTELYVTQGDANEDKPLTTTVTITLDGVAVATKTLTFLGIPATIEIKDVTVGKVGSVGVFRARVLDAAGNALYSKTVATDSTANAAPSVAAIASISASAVTGADGDWSGATQGQFTCVKSGTTTINVKTTISSVAGTSVKKSFPIACGGALDTWKISMDKASYAPGEIATLTVTGLDSKGFPVNTTDTLGTVEYSFGGLTAVTAPTSADKFSSAAGVKKYTFSVGTSEGAFVGTFKIAGATDTSAKTVQYKVAGSAGVTNADVLKAIVSLIASINKQIAALQKALLRR